MWVKNFALSRLAREAGGTSLNLIVDNDLLATTRDMAPVDAYMLCSVCGDLRIAEIVDQPNWVVSFYFPRVVLD